MGKIEIYKQSGGKEEDELSGDFLGWARVAAYRWFKSNI